MKGRRLLDVAILGTRGIPANYGGFETFAEHLSRRLVQRGHRVTVYCRNHYVEPRLDRLDGVRLRRLPAIRTKHLETISHTALSVFDSFFRRFQVLLFCNAANAFLCGLPRWTGRGVILNVDGIERLRRKWGSAGRFVYRAGERLATLLPSRIVADARTIQEYYRREYGCDARFIPYGAEVYRLESRTALDRLGLEPGGYLLYVSRLEPENNAHLVAAAYIEARLQLPLVLVGDAPYATEYKRRLRVLASRGNILLPGAIYGRGYRELLSHCLCYVQATEVGGTHPALLEAMASRALVLYHDTPEHREVVGGAGLALRFDQTAAAAACLRRVVEAPQEFDGLRLQAEERVREHYDWEKVTDQYEALMYEVAG
jgi:glycosyltransferase involved in cell wall biosynthesis